MYKTSLGIVIVNFNSAELLKKCVDSVFKSDVQDISLKVVVVDNNSKDDSLQINHFNNTELSVIKNSENKGFGYACNQGAEQLKGVDYILFLNPDTEVGRQTFKESITFLEKNKNISILGTLHENENRVIQISCSNTPTPIKIIYDILGLSKLFPKVFSPATLMTNFDHVKSRFVDQVMGAYMLMSKVDYEKVGGFDTRFFVYYEDADFALRAKKMGILSYYNSDIKILHHGRGTTKKIFHTTLFYNLRSRIQFTYKHYGKIYGVIILLLTLTIEPITRSLFNFIKNPSENKNTFIAFGLLYRDTFKK